MSFPANLLPTLGLTGRVGEHQPWDVASNHSQAGGHCTGQDAELMKGSTTWNQTQIFNFLFFCFCFFFKYTHSQAACTPHRAGVSTFVLHDAGRQDNGADPGLGDVVA